MENDIKKNVYTYTYVCITESLCCTTEFNATLQINYISVKKLDCITGFSYSTGYECKLMFTG